MSPELQALIDIRHIARDSREPTNRMILIEELADCAIEGRPWQGKLPKGDSVRRLAKQIIRRTNEAGSTLAAHWLLQRSVPASTSERDPVES